MPLSGQHDIGGSVRGAAACRRADATLPYSEMPPSGQHDMGFLCGAMYQGRLTPAVKPLCHTLVSAPKSHVIVSPSLRSRVHSANYLTACASQRHRSSLRHAVLSSEIPPSGQYDIGISWEYAVNLRCTGTAVQHGVLLPCVNIEKPCHSEGSELSR
jgi:hypothetical protein